MTALRAGPWPTRLGFALLVCLIQSTHLLVQPSLFDYWSLRDIALGWSDYFVECLCYGAGIILGATVGERMLPQLGTVAGPAALLALMAAGACIGGIAATLYYQVPLDYLANPRFIADTANWFAIGTVVVMIYALQRRSSRASARMRQAQVDRVALQKQTLEAQLQVMRAQIEPHFLFNTLANAKRLCQTNVARGVTMLDNLVLYLRAALPQMRDGAAITLGDEIDLVRAYVAVLSIRMGARLRFTSDVPERLRGHEFPPMMLLTLVENAIKHGINPSPDGGRIDVVASTSSGDLVLAVADTGVGFGVAATGGTGIGLANTRARLGALYGARAELSLAANEPHGVIVTVRVPASTVASHATGGALREVAGAS